MANENDGPKKAPLNVENFNPLEGLPRAPKNPEQPAQVIAKLSAETEQQIKASIELELSQTQANLLTALRLNQLNVEEDPSNSKMFRVEGLQVSISKNTNNRTLLDIHKTGDPINDRRIARSIFNSLNKSSKFQLTLAEDNSYLTTYFVDAKKNNLN